jgi:hypothetical protein
MGYREDVACVFSPDGWNQFLSAVKSYSAEDMDTVRGLINGADIARITLDGERFFKFDYVKTTTPDFSLLTDACKQVDENEYLVLMLGEDGGEEYFGDFHGNQFCIGVSRMISYDPCGNDFTGDDFFDVIDAPSTDAVTDSSVGGVINNITVSAHVCVDDHTCVGCGNTKCSKTEKSCWKCGCAI